MFNERQVYVLCSVGFSSIIFISRVFGQCVALALMCGRCAWSISLKRRKNLNWPASFSESCTRRSRSIGKRPRWPLSRWKKLSGQLSEKSSSMGKLAKLAKLAKVAGWVGNVAGVATGQLQQGHTVKKSEKQGRWGLHGCHQQQDRQNRQ
jgi:hypothetical protein